MTDNLPTQPTDSPERRTQLLGDDFIVEETENPQEAYILCSVADTVPIKQ